MKYIVALDQGTTSSRAVVFDAKGRMVAAHNIEFAQIYPHPGWVEHRPQDILDSQITSLKLAVAQAGIDAADIEAVGITNQRETTLLWDRKTGEPLCNAIVWQCRRTAPLVERLKQDGFPGRSCNGCWTAFPTPGSGRRRASCASERWTASWPGS